MNKRQAKKHLRKNTVLLQKMSLIRRLNKMGMVDWVLGLMEQKLEATLSKVLAGLENCMGASTEILGRKTK